MVATCDMAECWRALNMQWLIVRLHVMAARACMSTMRPRLVALASVAPLTCACSAASAACFSTTCGEGPDLATSNLQVVS